jgi:RNA polymerase primary sigma factor
MFGTILTSCDLPPRRRLDFDRIYRFPSGEAIRPEDPEPPAAAAASPALRIVPSESRRTSQDHLGRARRLLAAELTYVPHPSFDDPSAHDAILAPPPEPVEVSAPGRINPAYRDSYLAGYRGAPILSREQEAHLFRQMNYLKCLAARLRDRIDPQRPAAADLDEPERLHAESLKLKHQLVEANLRLVIAIVKDRARPGYDLSERVSDGNFALLLAVDRFDCARGTRFSTYASWAILNELALYDRRRKRQRHWPVALYEDALAAPDPGSAAHEVEEVQDRRREAVGRWLDRLDQRERRILASRHGFGGGPGQSLQQIGRDLGISKERVRQLVARAHDKLRKFARLEAFELAEI